MKAKHGIDTFVAKMGAEAIQSCSSGSTSTTSPRSSVSS